MSDLQEAVKKLAREFAPAIIDVRRQLHAHPELSFHEYQTAALVTEQLTAFGLTPVMMAETGVTAIIEGKNPGKKTVALRGDMDALPITEQNDVPYKSCNEGVMHACGHDVHTASLLGTARVLSQLRNQFEGTVKLIFQPGEELIPGGASLMIKAGVLQNPAPACIFGQHVFPHLPAGKVGVRAGMYMASADELYLTVKGQGGHGAMPDLNIDPVLIAAHIIVALQQIVSRVANPKTPTVLSFGKVTANGATNIIPDEVRLEGTFRTMDEAWRAQAHVKMKKMAEQMAEAMGGSCDFEIRRGYPYLQNSPQLTEHMRAAAEVYLGRENVVDLDLWMAAEDFAYYTQQIDACFYRLGTRNEARGIVSSVHTPTFDVDEAALETGIGLMAWLALNELSLP